MNQDRDNLERSIFVIGPGSAVDDALDSVDGAIPIIDLNQRS